MNDFNRSLYWNTLILHNKVEIFIINIKILYLRMMSALYQLKIKLGWRDAA